MKKLLAILSLFLSGKVFSQGTPFPINAATGTPTTTVLTRGVSAADSAYWYRTAFADTTAINLGRLDEIAGVLVRLADGTLVLRNPTATGWVTIGGGASPTGNFWNLTGNFVPVTPSGFGVGLNDPYNDLPFKTNNTTRVILPLNGLERQVTTGAFRYMLFDTTNKTWGYGDAGGTNWSLTGNSGTVAGTNFLGTTDNVDLVFKTGGAEYTRLNTSGRFGINASSGIIGKLHIRTDGIGTTQTDSTGLFLENSTAATSGNQQMSPGVVWKGNGWKSQSGGASMDVRWRADILPMQGMTSPSSAWRLAKSINGSNYETIFKVQSGGSATLWADSALSLFGYLNGIQIGTKGENVFYGNELSAITTGVSNYIIGGASGLKSGSYNVRVGSPGLFDTSGTFNVVVGFQALRDNTNGGSNTAVGTNALLSNTTAQKNTAIGAGAMENNTTGGFNVAVGQDAMLNNTTGFRNIGIGWNAKFGDSSYHNIGIGYQAGSSLAGGGNHDNTFIGGFQTGYNGAQKTNAVHSIAIGSYGYTTADYQLAITDSVNRFTFPGVSRGVANYVLTDSLGNGQYWVARPVGAATEVPLSGITAATGTNSINNGNHPQTWSWNTLDGVGLFLTSSSTVATGGTVLFGAQMTGAHSTSGITSTALDISNLHSGTTSINVGISSSAQSGTTNIAGKFEALSGTNNYAIIVPSGGGNVGIGTSTPTAKLDVVGNGSFSTDITTPLIIGGTGATSKITNKSTTGTGTTTAVAFDFLGGTNGATQVGQALNNGSWAFGAAADDGYFFTRLPNGNGGWLDRDASGQNVRSTTPSGITTWTNYTGSTNTVINQLAMQTVVVGTAANGLGTSLSFEAENGSGTVKQLTKIDGVYTDVTNASEDADFVLSNIDAGTLTESFRINSDGKPILRATNTAGGTTGDQTINKATGTVNFAAAATTITVTNSLCTTSSIVFCVVRTNDATATIKNVVPGSGSFVITLSAAATAETSVGFIVTN